MYSISLRINISSFFIIALELYLDFVSERVNKCLHIAEVSVGDFLFVS